MGSGSVNAEPQADVVTPLLWLGVVLEGGAVVEDPAVVRDQHLPSLKLKLDAKLGLSHQRLDQVQRFALRRLQRALCLFMPHLDVVVEIAQEQLSLIPGENRIFKYRGLVSGELAAPIKTERVVQCTQRLRMVDEQLVV
jgi:hypothetical protein